MRRLAAAALALAALAGGCGKDAAPEVRVFAASSLTEVMQTLAADYEKKTGTRVVLNLASSSTLAKQIVEGARCDLFLSADEEWADFVLEGSKGRSMFGSKQVLLTNQLVVVLGNPRNPPAFFPLYVRSGPIDEFGSGIVFLRATLLDPEIRRIAVGDPAHVPAGRYARQGLEAMGIWEECRRRLVPCESVRAALALVQSGEADVGIIYRTNAMTSGLGTVRGDVASVSEFSGETGGSVIGMAEFPGVEARVVGVPGQGPHSAGNEFFEWLQADHATSVFRASGFGIPGENR